MDCRPDQKEVRQCVAVVPYKHHVWAGTASANDMQESALLPFPVHTPVLMGTELPALSSALP